MINEDSKSVTSNLTETINRIQCSKCKKIFSKNTAFDKIHSKQCDSTLFTNTRTDINILDELLKFYSKEIKEEGTNTLKILLQGLSAYTKNPINSRILAPSGEGKTYLLNKIYSTFPQNSLIVLASASAQSFKYSYGKEVIEKENGEFTPLEEKIAPLEKKLEDTEDKAEKKKIKKSIASLKESAWHLIDLHDKWLIFLDSQSMSLWESLKTLLSHDSEYQKHQVTNKINGRNTQERMIFSGSPAVTYCSAKDESGHAIAPEMETRFDTIYLKSNSKKYAKSLELISQRHGLPSEIFEEEVVSKDDLEYAKELTKILIENVKMYGSSEHPVTNPYSEKLHTLFAHDSGARSRQYSRLMQTITMITLCNANKRYKVVIENNVYPVVVISDIERAVSIMKENSDLPSHKIQFFNDVFKPVFKKIAVETKLVNEDVKAVTGNEMVEGIKKHHSKDYKNLDVKKLRETYLDMLVDHGLLESAKDSRNASRNIYWISKPYKNSDVSLESPLISTSSLDKSCVESFVNNHLKQRFEQGTLRVVDSNNEDASLDDLIQNATCTVQNSHKINSSEATISSDCRSS